MFGHLSFHLASLFSTARGFPLGPECYLISLLDKSNPVGKGKSPVPVLQADGCGLWGNIPRSWGSAGLCSVVLMNVRSTRCGERLQPSGTALGRERPLQIPSYPDADQGFSRPSSHARDNLVSCGASFLLLSTLSLCLTFSETFLYFRPKLLLPLMLFPSPVNSLLVVNLRALGTPILLLFCQDNFLLPLLGANPLSSQIHSRRQ